MKRPWRWTDILALVLALLVFGTILAILVQNLLNLD